MSKKISGMALIAAATIGVLPASSALAASSGVLAITVTVAEKCRIDFSEGSADFFQVCSAAQGVSNERASNVLGAAIAIEPAADPYYLDRDPDNPSREAAPGTAPTASNSTPRPRRGPKVVQIHY
ncbi:hypothetical protein [Herbaspirillum sp. YR522]|uniref:hypothetical protein n=1 Tax=Herbaspirillum sp. YR522 TaxID=1144342 RepID=UPI00058ACEF0|nr:hypothetical protein [Herbaspirillum sp. YR522]